MTGPGDFDRRSHRITLPIYADRSGQIEGNLNFESGQILRSARSVDWFPSTLYGDASLRKQTTIPWSDKLIPCSES
jgi:hypothetical protein